MELKGTVHDILNIQEVNDKFSKQTVILKTDGEHPQYIPIDFINKNIRIVDNLMPSQYITVHINLNGKEYNGKYFVNIIGWKVE